MNFKELDFILNLKADQFVRGARQADQAQQKLRDKMGKPLEIRAKVDGAIASFARLGLALDGIQRTYRLVIGPMKQMVELSNIQEKADQKLIATLKTRNQYTEEYYKLLKQQASAIQGITTVGDEEVEMLQALALNMGATLDQVDEFTRGSIGLAESFAEAGLSQETAMKGIALAYQGNFTQLQRYIPALRDASTQAEKMALLQNSMAAGFSQAEDAAKTQAGEMEQWGNILGDVKELGGDIIKDFIDPLVTTSKPVLQFIAGMDKGTRNTSVAIAGFILVGTRVPGMLAAIRAGVIGLQASMGPAGWLLLGLGAVATAFALFSTKADDATDSMSNFREEVNGFSLDQAKRDLESLTQQLESFRARIGAGLIDEGQALFGGDLTPAMREWIDQQKEFGADFNKEIDTWSGKVIKNLEDKIGTLKARIKELSGTGEGEGGKKEPIISFMKDKDVEIQSARIQRVAKEFIINYDKMAQVSTDFTGLNMEMLDQEYLHRSELLNTQLEMMREANMQESAAYQDLIRTKWALDVQYESAKRNLARNGAIETIKVGAQLMDAFQGNIKEMFELGKGASIAEAYINAFLATERAFKDYPFPFNLAISATQFALAMAQVKKIEAQSFKPAGKASGGLITDADVMQSMFTPGGEDGIIGVRKYEYVMNQGATARFLPLLESLNAAGKRSRLPGYAQGGLIDHTGNITEGNINTEMLAAIMEDAIITGFNKSRLRVTGQLTGRGKDLQAVLDKNEDLKSQL